MTRAAQRSCVRSMLKCTPDILTHAPEMAVARVLHEAIDATCFALLAQHPTLLSEYLCRPEPRTLRAARRVLAASTTLQRALSSYADAVHDAIQATNESFDDLPF